MVIKKGRLIVFKYCLGQARSVQPQTRDSKVVGEDLLSISYLKIINHRYSF